MPESRNERVRGSCGKGTYVRALARDMGRIMGWLWTRHRAEEDRVGPFDEARAVTMATLLAAAESEDPGEIAKLLLPVESALADLPELLVSQTDAATLAVARQF